LFSIVVVLAYSPTSSVLGFLSPTFLPTFVAVCVLDNHFNSSEVELECGLGFHFLYGQGW
jgi:hypothetical protein